MWNLIAPNRILERKRKEYSYRKHRQTLRAIRPLIDNSTPTNYEFLNARQKPVQIKMERDQLISHENSELVHKMIKAKSGCGQQGGLRSKHSLHENYMKQMCSKIDQQNHQILIRLKSARSEYSKDKLRKSEKQYLGLKDQFSSARMDPYYDLSNSERRRPKSAWK